MTFTADDHSDAARSLVSRSAPGAADYGLMVSGLVIVGKRLVNKEGQGAGQKVVGSGGRSAAH